jgi:hypothetical protein
VLIALACVAAVLGFGALALLLDRHQEQMLRRTLRPGLRPWLRLAGTALLGLSYGLAACAQGAASGFILWFGLLTPCALLVAATFTALARRRASR